MTEKEQGVPVEFGKRVLTESYYEGNLRSIQISKTISTAADSSKDALEKATKQVMDLLFFGEPKKSISVQYDLDDRADSEHRVKRIHVTHISTKEQVPVLEKSHE